LASSGPGRVAARRPPRRDGPVGPADGVDHRVDRGVDLGRTASRGRMPPRAPSTRCGAASSAELAWRRQRTVVAGVEGLDRIGAWRPAPRRRRCSRGACAGPPRQLADRDRADAVGRGGQPSSRTTWSPGSGARRRPRS
jgi:hypothetical protein